MRFLRYGLLLVAVLSSLLPGAEPAETRAAFLRLLERPRVELAPEVTAGAPAGAFEKLQFSYTSEPGQRVPGYLLKPRGPAARRPAVIVLHGTGGTKESVAATAEDLVKAGFIAVAIDARHHGARTKAGSGAAEYNEAIVRAWRDGRSHPFYYDTVWDVMRLIDYLSSRDDIDPARIGAIGFSKGGIETYLAAAADPRLACVVPCIGVQSFRWALENGQWKARIATIQDAFDAIATSENVTRPEADFVRKFYARLVPGIDGQFDGPAMLPLIAPRPLLVINGDSDANTPVAGVRLAVDAARPVYATARAEDRLQLIIQENTPHRVNPASERAAVEWFIRWLEPSRL